MPLHTVLLITAIHVFTLLSLAILLNTSTLSSLSPPSLQDSAGSTHKGPTIPQPFHFSDLRRQQQQVEGSKKFVSMAELNLKFILGTPERFRTKRAGSVGKGEAAAVAVLETWDK